MLDTIRPVAVYNERGELYYPLCIDFDSERAAHVSAIDDTFSENEISSEEKCKNATPFTMSKYIFCLFGTL